MLYANVGQNQIMQTEIWPLIFLCRLKQKCEIKKLRNLKIWKTVIWLDYENFLSYKKQGFLTF